MTAKTNETVILPPGPAEKFDLNTTPESFEFIKSLMMDYPDICRIQSPTRESDSYLVNDPEYLKHILVKNYENYKKGIGFSRVKMLLGNGIIVSDGPFWRRQRRMMQPAFTRKVIAKLSHQIQQCNQRLFVDWTEKAKTNQTIDITQVSSELSLEIVMRAILSDDLDTLIKEQNGNPFSFLTDDFTRDLKVVLKFREVSKLLLNIINYRREQQPDRVDFLAMFMDSRDKETGEAMSDKELLDELMTLIVAGHETSAITLNWTWYFISLHPEVEHKVHQEVDASVNVGKFPEFDELDKLPYIKQVVEEALRYYPPVWMFSRKAINDDTLGDYFVPAGTDIFIAPYFLHRHPDYWADAETFDPERFTEAAVKKQHKNAYIPFSAGPRRCIGDFFATIEMQIHIGLMARSFKLEYIPDAAIKLDPDVNLRTRNPILMKITNR
ncbi:MAG: cytochrome P450 [Gammaproteobacteria bacterium]